MNSIHHLTLTVSNIEISKEWYTKLFGDADVFHLEGDGWKRVLLIWSSGFILGLTQHDDALPQDTFSHSRVGLDHLAVACRSEAEVTEWFDKLTALGFEHGPLEQAPYGWAVTSRDPDNIPIEFFSSSLS
jgi:catechol 2,3-dioxygenase-like lactoylglutathione lyase family enzyme